MSCYKLYREVPLVTDRPCSPLGLSTGQLHKALIDIGVSQVDIDLVHPWDILAPTRAACIKTKMGQVSLWMCRFLLKILGVMIGVGATSRSR